MRKLWTKPSKKSSQIPAGEDYFKVQLSISQSIIYPYSFRAVSEKYQVPKTLLWRRAKKLGYEKGEKQKDSTRILAIEAIKQGESLISLSKKYVCSLKVNWVYPLTVLNHRFNIPISTLHREKLKLYEKGQLPENVNLKNRSRGEDYEDRLRYVVLKRPMSQ